VTDASASTIEALMQEIAQVVESDLDRPWCVHRIYEEAVSPGGRFPLDDLLLKTELAANQLAAEGRLCAEAVSTVSIGVHCQDSVYWSLRSPHRKLEEFGPDYESPRVLYRLASHFRCRGL
jgi:hypothetical protein